MDERDLVARIKAGDNAAFRQLIEAHQDVVVRSCYGFVRNMDDADDIAQDVFVEVYRSITRFRGDARLSTWLYRIAVNKSLNHIRKTKRRGRLASLTGSRDDTDIDVADTRTVDVQTQLEDDERARLLADAVGRLPESQRIAFTLSKVEGMSQKEVAEVMDTSVAAVEALLTRAKAKLRKRLRKYWESR